MKTKSLKNFLGKMQYKEINPPAIVKGNIVLNSARNLPLEIGVSNSVISNLFNNSRIITNKNKYPAKIITGRLIIVAAWF